MNLTYKAVKSHINAYASFESFEIILLTKISYHTSIKHELTIPKNIKTMHLIDLIKIESQLNSSIFIQNVYLQNGIL